MRPDVDTICSDVLKHYPEATKDVASKSFDELHAALEVDYAGGDEVGILDLVLLKTKYDDLIDNLESASTFHNNFDIKLKGVLEELYEYVGLLCEQIEDAFYNTEEGMRILYHENQAAKDD